MATKTFKIGEYCKGGIITAEVSKSKVIIIGKEWDYSKGSNKGSDQSQAKEWTRLEVSTELSSSSRKLSDFLCDLTTSYYADIVMEYVKKNTTLKDSFFW